METLYAWLYAMSVCDWVLLLSAKTEAELRKKFVLTIRLHDINLLQEGIGQSIYRVGLVDRFYDDLLIVQ